MTLAGEEVRTEDLVDCEGYIGAGVGQYRPRDRLSQLRHAIFMEVAEEVDRRRPQIKPYQPGGEFKIGEFISNSRVSTDSGSIGLRLELTAGEAEPPFAGSYAAELICSMTEGGVGVRVDPPSLELLDPACHSVEKREDFKRILYRVLGVTEKGNE